MIGLKKNDVLNPFTKEPIKIEDTVKCRKIDSVGIYICEKTMSRKDRLKSMILSMVIIFIVGLIFSFNITIEVGETVSNSASFFTSIPPFIFILGMMVFGYIIGNMYSSCKIR